MQHVFKRIPVDIADENMQNPGVNDADNSTIKSLFNSRYTAWETIHHKNSRSAIY